MSGTGPLLGPPALKRLPPFESGAGREAVRLVELPRERWDWGWEADPPQLGRGRVRGRGGRRARRVVAHRLAAGGKDYDALEVEKIHFDERFPEDAFASRAPLPWR